MENLKAATEKRFQRQLTAKINTADFNNQQGINVKNL